ncbi:hypothetical protein, partial [Oscillibacter sp.]|uniref:hypothetical protein n=1 Tax=Oscillibacter sp. TaxID=1945593 RepID=UPI0028978F8A
MRSETEILKNQWKVFQYGKEDLLKQALSLDEQKSQFHQSKIAMGKQAAKLQHEEFLQLKQVNEQARSQTLKLARDIATQDYLQNTFAFQVLLRGDDANYSRIRSALTSEIFIAPPFDMSAQIKSSS